MKWKGAKIDGAKSKDRNKRDESDLKTCEVLGTSQV